MASTSITVLNQSNVPVLARLRFAGINVTDAVIAPGGEGRLPCEWVWYDLRVFDCNPKRAELAEHPSPASPHNGGRYVFSATGGGHDIRKVDATFLQRKGKEVGIGLTEGVVEVLKRETPPAVAAVKREIEALKPKAKRTALVAALVFPILTAVALAIAMVSLRALGFW